MEKTQRQLAIMWWNTLNFQERDRYLIKLCRGAGLEGVGITGREIEEIYKKVKAKD